MAGLEERPVLVRGRGSIVVDTEGREYLDFQSGQMGAALGHNHPRVMGAIADAMRALVHSSNTMLNVPRLELHERLGKLLVPPLQKSLFLVSGSDSIEGAVDLARRATGGLEATIVRPTPSGTVGETDTYGAQQHAPLLDLTVS
jgi:4-aminobutyrate aminotransferase-like enzyme